MKKKILATLLLGTAFFSNAEIKLIDLSESENKIIEKEVSDSLGGNTPGRFININNVKQIGDSENYYVKVEENGQKYTMMYMREIKSVVIGNTGDLYETNTGNFINKKYEADVVKPLLTSRVEKGDFIKYESDKSNPDVLVAFTDPTCGYCAKLHSEIEDYKDQGITIKYLPYPRGGSNGPGFELLAHAYCSEDKNKAFDIVKKHKIIPEEDITYTPVEFEACKAKVMKYYNLGNELNVTGTPAIFTESGYQIGGYLPALSAKQAILRNK